MSQKLRVQLVDGVYSFYKLRDSQKKVPIVHEHTVMCDERMGQCPAIIAAEEAGDGGVIKAWIMEDDVSFLLDHENHWRK